VQSTTWSKDLRVTADGTGVVSHVGAALLRMLADRAGLTGARRCAAGRRRWPLAAVAVCCRAVAFRRAARRWLAEPNLPPPRARRCDKD
jgi:hypothetical protein